MKAKKWTTEQAGLQKNFLDAEPFDPEKCQKIKGFEVILR